MSKITVIGLSGESIFLNVDHFNKKGETVKSIAFILNQVEKDIIKLLL